MWRKKIPILLGLSAEIFVLVLITRDVFWQIFFFIGRPLLEWIHLHIHTEAGAWIALEVVCLTSLAAIILLIKFKILRNVFLIVLTAWVFFLIDSLAFFCLLVTFMH